MTPPITGRCYCGAVSLSMDAFPQIVTYCHCSDCRRLTGAPVTAFAAFATNDLHIEPDPGPAISHTPGVKRWFCKSCGSPLAARFDYLPGQVYVPLGLLDQADQLPPSLHCHAKSGLPWLHIDDDLERSENSGRERLGRADK